MHVTSRILRCVLFAAMFAGFVSVPAHAQNLAVLTHVRIPFAFRSGLRLYPAGTYSVRVTANGLLQIQGNSASGNTIVRAHDYSGQQADRTKLIFARYGNRYFLEEIWTAKTGVHMDCVKTSEERELQQEMSLASSSNHRATVELAASQVHN
ncbi:MAG TPA: hypothetical protein VFN53_08415 [Acidobacteriaceae bacterium]|nr:hypothetical protein [Acidobacteriaceae bacterium]